jgi:hypothetical protein
MTTPNPIDALIDGLRYQIKGGIDAEFEQRALANWLRTHLEALTAAVREEERERIRKELESISTREVDGSWLPDGMHAYYDHDLATVFTTQDPQITNTEV